MQETVHVIERQDWLEPASDTVQKGLFNALDAGGPTAHRISDFLNGSWLGHPLHPVITDVPLGAWTVTLALDGAEMLTHTRRFAAGADASLTIGLVAALQAAASGLADWQYTVGQPRRVGMVHAVLNTVAASLYGASLIARWRDARKTGQLLSFLGYGIVAFSAYLGGDLVYRYRMAVDHAPEEQPPTDFTPVLGDRELAEGEMKQVDAGGVQVMLTRYQGQVYALANSCSHLGGPLADGQIKDGCVTCPWHGSTFRVQDGSIVSGPTAYPQPSYQTRVRDGLIEIRGEAQA